MNSKRLSNYSEDEMSDRDFENHLDEIYGDVEVCGYTYSSGRALKELDPVAFNMGKSDYGQYVCDSCGTVYDEEDDAKDCHPLWECGKCHQEYTDEDEADACCTEEED